MYSCCAMMFIVFVWVDVTLQKLIDIDFVAEGHAEVVGNSDYEQDHAKLVSLPPCRIELPTDKPVIQIASGQHHTGMC